MIQIKKAGPVTIFRMGRSIGPWVPYITHAFLVDETLIDTGTTAAENEFLDALGKIKVAQIINTHHHEDHIGNNHALQQRLGIPVFAHEEALPFISDTATIPLKLYQHLVWKRPGSSQADPLGDTVKTANHTFNVIHTPGHSNDHICLYEPDKKWLFAGDAYLGVNVINIRSDENFNDLMASVATLKNLDIDIIFCSLKGAVNNGTEQLKAKYEFMKKNRDAILRGYAGNNDPVSIRRSLFGFENWMHYLTGGHFSKQKLVDSVLDTKGVRDNEKQNN